MKTQSPNYKLIFADILEKKYPEKMKECEELLHKESYSALNILQLNQKIFGTSKISEKLNNRYRSYNKSDILKILDYQKKHKLNNSQLAIHFSLSRNTVAKWKKMFVV